MALSGHFYSFVDPVGRCAILGHIVFWVELPVQRRLCPIFIKSQVLEKGDSMGWFRVTRHPRIFRG